MLDTCARADRRVALGSCCKQFGGGLADIGRRKMSQLERAKAAAAKEPRVNLFGQTTNKNNAPVSRGTTRDFGIHGFDDC
mgnify:CR=1 FL=1